MINDLFAGLESRDICTMVRHDDPHPAHVAAKRMRVSGKAETNRETVFNLVAKNPECTAVELFHKQKGTALKRHEISRRLADLKKLNRVYCPSHRRCCYEGTLMSVWRIVP